MKPFSPLQRTGAVRLYIYADETYKEIRLKNRRSLQAELDHWFVEIEKNLGIDAVWEAHRDGGIITDGKGNRFYSAPSPGQRSRDWPWYLATGLGFTGPGQNAFYAADRKAQAERLMAAVKAEILARLSKVNSSPELGEWHRIEDFSNLKKYQEAIAELESEDRILRGQLLIRTVHSVRVGEIETVIQTDKSRTIRTVVALRPIPVEDMDQMSGYEE